MTTCCRFFETFSFLPPLDDSQIAKQVDYIIRQGWIPALEFADAEFAYVKNDSTIRMGGSATCNYYDNRWDPLSESFARLVGAHKVSPYWLLRQHVSDVDPSSLRHVQLGSARCAALQASFYAACLNARLQLAIFR